MGPYLEAFLKQIILKMRNNFILLSGNAIIPNFEIMAQRNG